VTTKGCASGFKLDVESAILGEGGGVCGGCCCCIAFGLIFRNLWFLNDSLPDPSKFKTGGTEELQQSYQYR